NRHKSMRRELDKLVDISEKITKLAEQNNWDSVNRLSLEREEKITIFFNQEIPEEMREYTLDAIEKIKKCDEETVRLVKNNRDTLGEEILSLRAKKQRIKD